jgi:S1-C subfamily serine protease
MTEQQRAQINFGVLEAKDGPTDVVAENGSAYKGLLLLKVDKFSSLGKAGLGPGDEILTIDGQPLTTPEALADHINKVGVGGTITARIKRGKEQKDIPVKLRPVRRLSLNIDEVDEVLERKISP